jgi:hypothetical protein
MGCASQRRSYADSPGRFDWRGGYQPAAASLQRRIRPMEHVARSNRRRFRASDRRFGQGLSDLGRSDGRRHRWRSNVGGVVACGKCHIGERRWSAICRLMHAFSERRGGLKKKRPGASRFAKICVLPPRRKSSQRCGRRRLSASRSRSVTSTSERQLCCRSNRTCIHFSRSLIERACSKRGRTGDVGTTQSSAIVRIIDDVCLILTSKRSSWTI